MGLRDLFRRRRPRSRRRAYDREQVARAQYHNMKRAQQRIKFRAGIEKDLR